MKLSELKKQQPPDMSSIGSEKDLPPMG